MLPDLAVPDREVDCDDPLGRCERWGSCDALAHAVWYATDPHHIYALLTTPLDSYHCLHA